MGNFVLTWNVKIGYNTPMVREVVSFVMRAGLVIGIWGLIWSVAEPKTQAMRILRATLLVLSLLGVWVLLSITGA
jgi:membrane-bound ClpP family serine protease